MDGITWVISRVRSGSIIVASMMMENSLFLWNQSISTVDTDSRHLRTTFAFLRQNVRYFQRKFFYFLKKIIQNQSISKSMEQSQPRLVCQLVARIHNQLEHVAGQLVGEEWHGRVKSQIFYKKLTCHLFLILFVLKPITNVISNR